MKKTIFALLIFMTACVYVPKPPAMFRPGVRRALKLSVTAITAEGKLLGTGFAVSDNLIMTAAHICAHAEAPVQLDQGYVYYADAAEDICLLYNPDHGLIPLLFAGAAPRFGDHVWVFGHPGGRLNILTEGYVGDMTEINIEEWGGSRLRLSAPAFGGNSGGPVLDDEGNVVGMLVIGVPRYPIVSYSARYEKMTRLLGVMP